MVGDRAVLGIGMAGYAFMGRAHSQAWRTVGRINLLQHGAITFDKPTSQTSVQELTDLVVAEYRAARTSRLRPDPSQNARPAPHQ
jgi:hypothetical protein